MPAFRQSRRLGIALLLFAGAAAAEGGASATTRMQATAAQMQILADRLIETGQDRKAEQLLELLASDPNADVRAEARFRWAALLESRGKDRDAAVLLRRVLDDRPDAAPVRLKLATLFQKMGDESSALRELRMLRTSDLPPNVVRFVDRFSASLQASKPIGLQIEVALAPDTNINRAPRASVLNTILGDFTFDEQSKKRSGVGVTLRSFVQARQPVLRDLHLVARASGETNLYRQKRFNQMALEFAVGPEWKLGRTRFSAEAGIGQQWYGMKPFQRSSRLSSSITRPIDSVSQLRLDGGARWTDNRFNDLQGGKGLSLRARYERALTPSLLVVADFGVDRFKARDDAYSTRSWNAGLSAFQQIGRTTLSAGIETGRLKADERLSILPDAREDRFLRLSLGAVLRQFTVAGFAPVTRLVYERNRSSVEFYDYERTRTEFGISRAF